MSRQRDFIVEINEVVEEAVDEALLLLEEGRMKEARHYLDGLFKKHPGYYMVLYSMGMLCAFEEKNEEAIVYLDKAIEAFPYFTQAYYNKAVVYKKQLNLSDYLRTFKKLVEVADSDDEFARKARKELSDFDREIQRENGVTMDIYLENGERFQSAFSLMQNRQWKRAMEGFQQCLKVLPDHVQSWGNLGLCYAFLGRKELALSAFDRALTLDPHYDLAAVNRALVERTKEGEGLKDCDFNSVDYYADFSVKKKSYLKWFLEEV